MDHMPTLSVNAIATLDAPLDAEQESALTRAVDIDRRNNKIARWVWIFYALTFFLQFGVMGLAEPWLLIMLLIPAVPMGIIWKLWPSNMMFHSTCERLERKGHRVITEDHRTRILKQLQSKVP